LLEKGTRSLRHEPKVGGQLLERAASSAREVAPALRSRLETCKGIVVDLIGVADKPKRAKEVVALGVEFVEMHAGLDEQAEESFTFFTLLDDGRSSGVPFSVAGGINLSTIASV
jgi:3-hexulose-6-phosphate synthase